MERKPGRTTTVAADELKAALSGASGLTGEEEKVLRMRHGVGVDLSAPLPKAAAGSANLAGKLQAVEADLFRALVQPGPVQPLAGASEGPEPSAADARAKSKIIRALRKKR